MRKQLVIYKQDLKSVYGQNILRFDNGFKYAYTRNFDVDLLPETPIRLRKYDSYNTIAASSSKSYEMLGVVSLSDSYRFFVIPEHIVKEIELPGLSEMITPVLDQLMPGRWFTTKYDDSLILYLHYPEITISNDAGQQHKITDLVVQVFFSEEGRLTGFPEGTRLSVTADELTSGYAHSHLSKGSIGSWGSFCFGDGSPVYKLVNSLCHEITEHSFALFLIQLEQYLQWESIGGRPYMLIANINSTTENDNINDEISVNTIESLLINPLLDELTPDMLTKHALGYIINPSLNPEKWLEMEKLMIELGIRGYDYDVLTNKFVNTVTNDRLPSEIRSQQMRSIADKFNITPRITAVEQTRERKTIKRVAPKVFRVVIVYLNNVLSNNTKINNEENRITTESKDNNNTKSIEPDYLFA